MELDFILLEGIPKKTKEGNEYYQVISYCPNYQFMIKLYATKDAFEVINNFAKSHDGDISPYVKPYFDNKTNSIRFVIK